MGQQTEATTGCLPGTLQGQIQYWTGLGPIIRFILFAVFGNVLGNPQVNLFASCILMMIYCWNVGNIIYMNWMLNHSLF